jgi:hypothetical protein
MSMCEKTKHVSQSEEGYNVAPFFYIAGSREGAGSCIAITQKECVIHAESGRPLEHSDLSSWIGRGKLYFE